MWRHAFFFLLNKGSEQYFREYWFNSFRDFFLPLGFPRGADTVAGRRMAGLCSLAYYLDIERTQFFISLKD